MKKGENYIKKGGKGLKNAYLIVGEKINLKRGGGGNDQNAQYISMSGYCL